MQILKESQEECHSLVSMRTGFQANDDQRAELRFHNTKAGQGGLVSMFANCSMKFPTQTLWKKMDHPKSNVVQYSPPLSLSVLQEFERVQNWNGWMAECLLESGNVLIADEEEEMKDANREAEEEEEEFDQSNKATTIPFNLKEPAPCIPS